MSLKIVLASVLDACFTSGSKKYETVNGFEFKSMKNGTKHLQFLKYNNVHVM